jgi:predicted transcriptional regulator of viral defense system
MNPTSLSEPAWQALYDVAATQEGLFTARQAASAGYSPPLLIHHQKAGRTARVRRSIYRLIHYPPGEPEELVTAGLWSESKKSLRSRAEGSWRLHRV